MHEDITYEMILQRMLDRVPNDVDKSEGSIIWDALAPAAAELKQMYIELDNTLDESYADKASWDFLIRRASERRIYPNTATSAILKGTFTPTNINITGQRFNAPNRDSNYIVKDMISAGEYRVECETTGKIGNEYLGDLIPIDYIDGLQKSELTQVLIPGEDEEGKEDFRERYFSSFSTKRFGGNRADYIYETKDLPGIGGVKVLSVWNGGGTVKLIIQDSNFNTATQTLIDNVQLAIDPYPHGEGLGLAPIGHTVTVVSVDEMLIDITMQLSYSNGYSWLVIQQEATQIIENYFLELRKMWMNESNLVVRISQIESRILTITGVLDIENTMINNSSLNLILADNSIPVLRSVLTQ